MLKPRARYTRDTYRNESTQKRLIIYFHPRPGWFIAETQGNNKRTGGLEKKTGESAVGMYSRESLSESTR